MFGTCGFPLDVALVTVKAGSGGGSCKERRGAGQYSCRVKEHYNVNLGNLILRAHKTGGANQWKQPQSFNWGCFSRSDKNIGYSRP
jgi:hypothetical protein